MKLHLQSGSQQEYLIRGYSASEIIINDNAYHRSLILAPDRVIPDWAPQSHEALAVTDWEPLLLLQPEVILLGTGTGTGTGLRFPSAAQLLPLIQAGIGYEVMDTAAACRTYNILMGEGRRVVAGLILPGAAQ